MQQNITASEDSHALPSTGNFITDSDFYNDEDWVNVVKQLIETEKDEALSFHGDVTLAKAFSENEYKRLRLNENNFDNCLSVTSLDQSRLLNTRKEDKYGLLTALFPLPFKTNTLTNSEKFQGPPDTNHSDCKHIKEDNGSIVSSGSYVVSKMNPWYGPNKNESRLEYLLRFPYLLQEGMNTGNINMIKHLFAEALAEDCALENGEAMVPIGGREKIYGFHTMILNSFPDYFSVVYNIKKVSTCIYSFKRNSFFTYLSNMGTQAFDQWLEKVQVVEKMDENMKNTIQNFYLLKHQDIPIKFERKSDVYMRLNKDFTHIERLVIVNHFFEVYPQ